MDKEFLERYELLLQEDVELALELCKTKFEETNNPDILVYIGDCFMSLDDYEGAVVAFEEGIAAGCSNITFAKSLMGEALFYLNRFEESKIIFTELLNDNPSSFFSIAYLTDIDINLGNYEEGVERAEAAILSNTLDHKDTAYIKANLGWIKLKYLNNSKDAYDDFQSAMDLDCTLGSPYIGLGEYYLKDKQYQDALDAFETAIDLGENTIEVYLGIALCYKGLDLKEDALEYFKIVNEADPENEIAKKELNS